MRSVLTFVSLSVIWGFLLLSVPSSAFVSQGSSRAFVSSRLSVAQDTQQDEVSSDVMDRSTLTLLEHINLNVPNHDYIIPFYVKLLGLGLDPRKAENVVAGTKTVWVNCGASQFHLPYGETPQVIPGHVGLLYNDLEPLKERVQKAIISSSQKCFQSHEITQDHVKLVDIYGNVFYCREKPAKMGKLRQPLVTKNDTVQFGDVATKYGVAGESECRGIDYLELNCPAGSSERVAEFYDCVLDATTSVLVDVEENTKIAVIGIGNIDANGRPAQCLVFRETTADLPPYDGHHVAMYVGDTQADFEQAFKNAKTAGIVWVNPRFSDKAETLQGARTYKQFRFKDIVDMETGETLLELEHEMRSVEHQFWPGGSE